MKKFLWILFFTIYGLTLLYSFGKKEVQPQINVEEQIFAAIESENLEELKDLLLKESPQLNSKFPSGETPLTLAASLGNKEIVLLLLNNLADPEQKNSNGSTALLTAMDNKKYNAVNALLLWDADVSATDSDGETALFKAIEDDNTELVKKLINIGSEISGKDADENSIYHIAVRKKNIEVLNLLQPSANELKLENANDETPLSLALLSNDIELLKSLTAQIDLTDFQYQEGTLLHYAVKEGKKELVEYLVNRNNSLIGLKDNQNRTALEIGLERPKSLIHMEIAEYLILQGSPEPKASELYYFFRVVDRNNGNLDFGGGSRALHLAAESNHLGTAKLLLRSYPINIDIRDEYGSTPLLYAIKRGHESMAELLLEEGASVNIQDSNGLGPVHYAIRLENGIQLCKMLSEYGMSFLHQDNLGNTALHIAIQYNLGDDKIRYLLENGTDPNVRNKQGNTPLLEAIMREQKGSITLLRGVSDLFAQNQQNLSPVSVILSMDLEWVDWFFGSDDINASDFQGNSILHYAASFTGRELSNDKINLLVNKGAQLNRRNAAGDSPLHAAVKASYWNTANLLVNLGSNLYLMNNENFSPLLLAFEKGSDFTQSMLTGETPILELPDNQGNTPLLIAIGEGYKNIATLLINLGANGNQSNYRGINALLASIEKGYLNLFHLLLDRGADINQGDNNGDSALHYLVKDSILFNRELGELLIDQGLNVNSPNADGQTAMHYSVLYNSTAALAFLIDTGGNIEATDKNGFTPLFYAVMGNYPETYRYLKSKGANLRVRDYQGNTLLHGAIVEALEDNNTQLIRQLVLDGLDMFGLNAQKDSPLSLAITFGPAVLDKLLFEDSINLQDNTGNSPLHIALESTENPQIWKLMVNKGADLNLRNGRSLTPYQWGKTLGYSDEKISFLRPE